MSRIDELSRIFIRAKVNGKWESVSIADAPLDEVLRWFSKKACKAVSPHAFDDEGHLKATLTYILEELLDVPLVKLKEGPDEG